MLSLAFCDDDTNYLHTLTTSVKSELYKLGIPYSLTCFCSGKDLVSHYQTNKQGFDMVFLDINMPEQDGLSTAAALRTYDQQVLLIFLTSMADKVYDAFGYNAFKFIRKDLGLLNFIEHFNTCLTQKHLLEKTFIFLTLEGPLKLTEQDIVFFEIVCRKFYVQTLHTRYRLLVDSFESLGTLLDKHPFFEMPNRSCLVNLRYVTHITKQNQVTLKVLDRHYSFEISRYKKHSFYDAFIRHIK